MMLGQRGAILPKLFLIPAAACLMVGFFFLGFYVGKYQGKTATPGDTITPLPAVESKTQPRQEEYTFFKTLTDKDSKTVSIDLKPKADAVVEKEKVDSKPATTAPVKPAAELQAPKENKAEVKPEPAAPVPAQKSAAAAKAPAKKEVVKTAAAKNGVRYTVQIASYPDKGQAEDEIKRLKKRGYAAFLVSSEVQGKGTWYRVRLGSFTNKTAAEKLQKEIRSKAGVSSMVVPE